MRYVISLSSIPPRFDKLGPALQSLLRQKLRPEAIELYIPRTYRRFPDWGGGLPDLPEGIRLVRVDRDCGPATKVIPAAKAWRGQEVDLLYVDDDVAFARDWAGRCLQARRAHPGAVLCGAALQLDQLDRPWTPEGHVPRAICAPPPSGQPLYHLHRLVAGAFRWRGGQARLASPARKLDRSGFADIAMGYGGVAIRPEFLDDVADDPPATLWAVDDIWLSGHFARRGVPIWADRTLDRGRRVIAASRAEPLYNAVIEGADRRAANRACVDHMRAVFGVWGGVPDDAGSRAGVAAHRT